MQSKPEYLEFSVPVTFTFTGTVKVRAASKEQSEDIARNNFGMVASSGSFHDNDSRVVDWTFDTHPEKVVGELVDMKSAQMTATDTHEHKDVDEKKKVRWYNAPDSELIEMWRFYNANWYDFAIGLMSDMKKRNHS